jgi:hypothetical protein
MGLKLKSKWGRQLQTDECKKLSGFIKTPSLFKNNVYQGIRILKFPINAIDQSQLAKYNYAGSYKIGKSAESFTKYILGCQGYEILLSNQQLSADKKTIGELDLIVRSEADQFIHIECAYKIYLYRSDLDPIDPWFGPNQNDKLSQKIGHLVNHQLPVLYSDPSKKLLNDHQIDINRIAQRIMVKAQLFLPFIKDVTLDDWINPSCIAGVWMNKKDWHKYKTQCESVAVIDKPFWFLQNTDDFTGFLTPLENDFEKDEDFSESKSIMVLVTINGSQQKIFIC